jgi:hypothetical protein
MQGERPGVLGGVGAAVDLTVVGALRLATISGSAIAGAIHPGLPGAGRD